MIEHLYIERNSSVIFQRTYANTWGKSVACIALRASLLFFSIVSSTAFCSDIVSNLETVAPSARPALVSESIIDASKNTKDLVFEVDIAFTGKERELKLENSYPSSPNGTAKLVTSNSKGFAFVDNSPIIKSKETFDGKLSSVYRYKKNRMYQVDSDCQLPLVNPLVAFFCRITGASCWRTNNSEACTTEVWARKFGAMEFLEFSKLDGHAVAVLVEKSLEGKRVTKHFFGDFQDRLVWKGSSSIFEKSYDEAPGRPAHIVNRLSDLRCDYRKVAGKTIPSTYTNSVVEVFFHPDRTSYGPPSLVLEITARVKNCKILPKFPDEMLSIPISADAKIVNYCEERKQVAVQHQVTKSQQSGWKWWLLAGGLALCAIARVVKQHRKK
jgi:hypothetical protein